MPHYNKDWFSGNVRFLENALAEYKGRPNLTFLEIGSHEGRSANWFLDNVLTGENCGLICVDSFEGVRLEKEEGVNTSPIKKQFLENMEQHEGKYLLLEGSSQDVLRDSKYDGKITVVYVDGSHRADDTMIDLVNSYYLLKKDGLMLIDDYLWNQQRYPAHEIPKTAIDAFSMIFKDKVETMFVSNKLVVMKKL